MAKKRRRRNPDVAGYPSNEPTGVIGTAGGIVASGASAAEKVLNAIAAAFAPPAVTVAAKPVNAAAFAKGKKLAALRTPKAVSLATAAADIALLRDALEAQKKIAEKAREDVIKSLGNVEAAEIREKERYADSAEREVVALQKKYDQIMGGLGAGSPAVAVAAAVGAAAAPKAARGERVLKLPGRVAGKRRRGRGTYVSVTKSGRFSKRSFRRLKRIGGKRVRYLGKGKTRRMIIKMNPGLGSVVGLLTAAAGMGAGYVVATNVVPKLVGKVAPQAASGVVGLVVGGLGAYAVSRVVSKVAPGVAPQLYVGALAAVGAGLISLLVNKAPVPANVKSAVGLGRMGDYLQVVNGRGMGDFMQLSGPVPEQLFAGGLNDFVDFASPSAGRAAEVASAAVVDWMPAGSEGF